MWLNIKSFQEYQETFKESEEDRLAFWEHEAGTFYWRKRWDNVQSGSFETADIKWFEGGKLNITENALQRHIPERLLGHASRSVAALGADNDGEMGTRGHTDPG